MNEWFVNNYQWLGAVILNIVALFFSYFKLKTNFKNEIYKIKQEVAINAMQEVPYELCQLMNNVTIKKRSLNQNVADLKKIMYKTISYGSRNAIKIASYMQQNSFENKENQKNNEQDYTALICSSLLITQIKYDLTSEIIPPDSYLKISINDYSNHKKEFIKLINETVIKLCLDRKFMINN